MAKNKSSNGSNISGRNIYLDRHGETVYYDLLSKKGYIIDSKVEGKFYIYKNRYFLIPIMLILVAEYFPSWIHVVFAGIAMCLLAEGLFRFKFLPSLRQTTKFDRENRKTMLKSTIDSKEPKKVLLRAVLYIAFAVLIIANALMIKADFAIMAVSVLLCLGACYCAIVNVIAFMKMK